MRAQEFITPRLRENIENFPIANVRRPNGAIGNQGVNIEQAADVLTHAAGMQVSPDMSMRQLVDALRADPAAQQRLRQFVQQNPITVYALPDGSYHLQDGHHRTFLLNLLGDETVPAIVKEDVTEAKTVEFEGLTLKVIKQGHELIVDALDDWGNKVLGHVKFNIGDGKELDPQDLHVDDKYQGQGIARVMYDYVKSLGYTINRSWDQTDAGAGFWNKHRGEDVRVWESFLDEANASAVQFQTASTDNYQSSFTVTAIADGKTVGHFSFFRDPETDDVHNQAEVTDDVQGKGYGKALLLKAIEVANDHGLGFQEDSQSLSRAQSRVYDSLYDAGWIVDADGYWFLTPEGEQELARISTMQQGVAENFADGKNPGRKEIDPDVYEDLSNSIIARTARQIVPTIRAKSTPEGYVYLSTQDGLSLVIGCNIAGGSIDINIGSQPMETTSSGPHKGAVTKIIEAVYQAAAKKYGAPIKQGTLSIDHDAGHGVWQHIAQKLGLQHDAHMVKENFADGKNPGRKGLAKRSGVNTKASVSSLRKTAKNSSGEKQRMAHWLANMKAGRAKAKRK
jgi:GNAT superfamily N-acetyltransferase